MSSFYCCKDCQERSVGCHSTCERYLEARAAHEKHEAQLKLNREFYNYACANMAKRTDRVAKKKKKQAGYGCLRGSR